jgi:hypothetical protein
VEGAVGTHSDACLDQAVSVPLADVRDYKASTLDSLYDSLLSVLPWKILPEEAGNRAQAFDRPSQALDGLATLRQRCAEEGEV